MYIKNIIIIITISLSLLGCNSIPAEAPLLSTEIGKRMAAIETANITLLNKFFSQKRREIDRFIEDEWLPEFSNTFFSKKKISKAWNTIVIERDKKQRLKFIVKNGAKLQKKINKKRQELMTPLDELERRIIKKIRDEYAQVKLMNNSVTSFLVSAAKVSENRNRYLEKIGITDSDVGSYIDKTDDAVTKLLEKSNKIKNKVTRSEDFVTKMKAMKNKI